MRGRRCVELDRRAYYHAHADTHADTRADTHHAHASCYPSQYICLQHLQNQRTLRKQVDEAGAAICALNDKQYKSMLNTNKKLRIQQVKQEMQTRAEEATEDPWEKPIELLEKLLDMHEVPS